jgi:hypothetical protein
MFLARSLAPRSRSVAGNNANTLLSRVRHVFIGLMALCFAGPVLASTPTTTTLVLSPTGTVVTRTAVTLTASVSNGAAVTSGTVNFCNSSMSVCLPEDGLYGTAQLTSAGTAIANVRLGVGTHNITAVFVGTTNNAASTSTPQALVVSASQIWASTTSLTSSGNAGNYTLSGVVSGFGNQPLSGTLEFLDTTNNNAEIGSATLGTPTYSLASWGTYPTGNGPTSLSVGDFNVDFNGDGIPDLVTVNANSNTLSLLFGNGDGTFQTPTTYPTGSMPASLSAGDFNGDGIPDLVVTNVSSNTVSVLLGNGDGTFQSQVTYTAGTDPVAIGVGDLNGDGILDLAVTNIVDNTVSILLGNGNGTFQAPVAYLTGSDPQAIRVRDFNGDGKLDLAVLNYLGETVSVLFGNGDGTFQAQVTYPTGNQPEGLSVGDFNGDGIPDLAIANSDTDSVSVLLGNGNGTFQAQVVYPTGNQPEGLSMGDFNGDGKLDLALDLVDSFQLSRVILMLGNGDGTFQTPVSYPTGTSGGRMTVRDLNGDGIPDMAMTDAVSASVSVMLGEQVANFSVSNISVDGTSGTQNVVAGYPGDTSRTASTSGSVPLNSPISAKASIPSIVLTESAAATPFVPVTGTGGTGTYTYTVSPALPTGLAMASINGTVSGTPTVTSTATTYTITTTDSNGATATAHFILTVNPAVTATTIVPATALTVNQLATAFTPVQGGGGTAPLSYTVSPALPAGIIFSSVGSISGTPTAAIGATTYTVTVTDANGASATATFALTVAKSNLQAKTVVPVIALTEGTSAQTVIPVTTTGGVAPIRYSISPSMPFELNLLVASGAITGTPLSVLSTTTYTITATDATGTTASGTFTITINPAVTASSNGTQTLTQNKSTTFTPVSGSGGTGALTYSVGPGLPTGLSIAPASGAVSGMPTATMSLSVFTVSVVDANGSKAEKTFFLSVATGVTATTVIPAETLTEDVAATPFQPVTGAGGVGTLTYSVRGGLPRGLSMSTAGVISGTIAEDLRTTTYQVAVSDSNGATAVADFTLEVLPPA